MQENEKIEHWRISGATKKLYLVLLHKFAVHTFPYLMKIGNNGPKKESNMENNVLYLMGNFINTNNQNRSRSD